jgi:hypothetical protein
MEGLRRHQSLVVAGTAAFVVAGTLAAGCDSHATRPKPATVRESCNESWVPTAQTFKGYGAWRMTSIRIGPITLLGAHAAAERDVAAYGSIKFRTLVRPRTPVKVEIAPASRAAVGFVPPADAERSIWPKRGAPILRLAPCVANFPPARGVLAIGYPMFLRVRRNACVRFRVEETRPGRSTRGTVSIGAGKCPRSA